MMKVIRRASAANCTMKMMLRWEKAKGWAHSQLHLLRFDSNK